ncbi:YodC family protein [Stutzerimonas stutzeri]|uniref:YodC family protein n=1 Tax=Stutzerimonas stutzeri TaxID=316 RepID=UPI0005EB7944|nr:DUF2158 domain-containing protein [Stutzerimonas stutzeri]
MSFVRGDVVMLKSGGPLMTVDDLFQDYQTHEPLVRCVWFGTAETPQYANFRPEQIEKQED